MQNFESFSIHDVRILRLIESQAKEARKADGIDDDLTRDKRLALTHLEYCTNTLIRLIEEEKEMI